MKDHIQEVHKAARFGWVWASIEQFGARAISLVVGIILARLLSPEDFGLIASVSIFMTVSQQIIDGGISQRVIQKETVGDREYCALFFCNLAMSGFMALCLIGSAGWIASYFDQQALNPLVMVLGGSVFLSNAGRVQLAKLTREMRYRKIAIIRLIAAVMGAAVGIVMALIGYGIWALVGQMLTNAGVSVILLWILAPWRPKSLPEWLVLRDLYAFGLPVFVSQTVRSVANQLVNVLTAKYYSPTTLGYLDRGRLMPQTLTMSIGNVLSKVNFPALSKLQSDPDRLSSTYLSFLAIGLGATSLVLVGMGTYAHEIVYVVLGEKWLPSVWFFQIACALGVIQVVYLLNADLLRSLGKTKIFFKVNMICALMQVVFVVVGMKWGVRGMVVGDLIARFIALLMMLMAVSGSSMIRVSDQFKIILGQARWGVPLVVLLLTIKYEVDFFFLRVVLGVLLSGCFLWFWWKAEGRKLASLT